MREPQEVCAGEKMTLSEDEEMAYRLVDLYVREISQRGEKRQMGLNTIINAYFYTLSRLKKKKEEMGILEPLVEKEEEKMGEGIEKVYFPEPDEQFDFE
jgi:spore maturation protein CgeB